MFKKIDSTFRGNTFFEIAATIHAFPGRLPLIAPAFPALGRTCRGGVLCVEDVTGTTELPLAQPLREAGVDPFWLSGTTDQAALADKLREASQPVFYGAATEAELRTVVKAALSMQRQILWIGSGGLANALAAELYPTVATTPRTFQGSILCFNGSTHPVTARQLAAAGDTLDVVQVQRGITADAELRKQAAGRRFRTLVLTGGDTAMQVCRALGITSIHLQGEYAPGVAQGTAYGGPYAGVTMVLKSGGFGAENLLLGMAERCEKEPI